MRVCSRKPVVVSLLCVSLFGCGVALDDVQGHLTGLNIDQITGRLGQPTGVFPLNHSNGEVYVFRNEKPGEACTPSMVDALGKTFCEIAALNTECDLQLVVDKVGNVVDTSLRDPSTAGGSACQEMFAALGFK